MAVHLGARHQSGFDDPLGLLSDCHRRIEAFLAILLRVAERASQEPGAGPVGLADDARRALNSALVYFREAAPKHTQDEEESLFPRMREAAGEDVRAAMVAVERLERDHDLADGLHERVDAVGRRWLERGSLERHELGELAGMLAELRALYAAHIRLEDERVFPLAAGVLSAEELKAVGEEMAARRGLRAGGSHPGGGSSRST